MATKRRKISAQARAGALVGAQGRTTTTTTAAIVARADVTTGPRLLGRLRNQFVRLL
ncbi:MAG: hypothetical protein ACLPQS_18100 [Acidimicrobiales bacterium]